MVRSSFAHSQLLDDRNTCRSLHQTIEPVHFMFQRLNPLQQRLPLSQHFQAPLVCTLRREIKSVPRVPLVLERHQPSGRVLRRLAEDQKQEGFDSGQLAGTHPQPFPAASCSIRIAAVADGVRCRFSQAIHARVLTPTWAAAAACVRPSRERSARSFFRQSSRFFRMETMLYNVQVVGKPKKLLAPGLLADDGGVHVNPSWSRRSPGCQRCCPRAARSASSATFAGVPGGAAHACAAGCVGVVAPTILRRGRSLFVLAAL